MGREASRAPKSGAGQKFLLLDCRAKAFAKGMFFSQTPVPYHAHCYIRSAGIVARDGGKAVVFLGPKHDFLEKRLTRRHINHGNWLNPHRAQTFQNRAFRAYPLIEVRQTVPCRAIRGSRISVNSTGNLCTRIPDFRGSDSSIVLISRRGMLTSVGKFAESLSNSGKSQQGKLCPQDNSREFWQSQQG